MGIVLPKAAGMQEISLLREGIQEIVITHSCVIRFKNICDISLNRRAGVQCE